MPATSPYQNNDYQALNSFRPYRLPVNDIFRANNALDAYWDEGAQKVKNANDNALNLKLRSTDNIQVRDQFMKDAEKSLVKVSTMDLSDGAVQRQGLNIFTPLFKDENIVGEDYVVRNGEKELAVGEGFRTKDGGKNYNPLSVQNIQYEQSLLTKPTEYNGLNKRDGWKAIAQAQSKYTPYTDMSKEYEQIAKNVKAQDIKTAQESGNGWMINTIEEKGVDKERMRAAIDAMGSPALKAQMAVEARNIYYKKLDADPAGVDGYYQGLAQSYYETKINDIKTQKNSLDYESKMTPKDSKDPDVKKSNLERIEMLNAASKKLGENITQLQTKDMPAYMGSFKGLANPNNLSSNASKIEQLWEASSMDSAAQALSWKSRLQDTKANPAKIAYEAQVLGYARLQKDMLQLSETKRSNMANEQNNKEKNAIDLAKALSGGKGKGKNADGTDASDSNEDPTAAGMSNAMNTPLVSTMNDETRALVAKKVMNSLIQTDEPLREAAITSILGDKAWQGIQGGVESNRAIGDDVLIGHELDDAVNLVSAYADKHPGFRPLNANIPLTDMTPQEQKNWVSNLPTGTFKQMIGDMVKGDSEFVADLAGKIGGERGADIAANFRGIINMRHADAINASNNISSKTAKRLGEYAGWFQNSGKEVLTDQAIETARQKGILDSSNPLRVYYKKVEGTPIATSFGGTQSSTQLVPVSKEEYLKLKAAGQPVTAGEPTKEAFNAEIRRRTDDVYADFATESNQKSLPYIYNPKDIEKKNADALWLTNLIAPSADTDETAVTDYKNVLMRFAQHIVSREIIYPAEGEQLPRIRFHMQGGWTDKADPEMDKKIDMINNTTFPITGLDPMYYAHAGEDSYTRNPNSNLVVAPFHSEAGNGTVTIKNYSRSAVTIDPYITIEGKLYSKQFGRDLTPKDIENGYLAFSSRRGGPPTTMQQALLNNGGRSLVNTYIAGLLTNTEIFNKKKDKK